MRRRGRPPEWDRELGHPVMEQLRAVRQEAGWTQARLARELGVVPEMVSRWERGRGKPISMEDAERYAAVFGLRIRWRVEPGCFS